eukprot:GHVN01077083.1.p1 GENE.GHVN01077083.1~~GHVN01077083.1.p1  ORF type:complete len:779 (-),score=196.10 GHVN01077083.1:179-2515(-)
MLWRSPLVLKVPEIVLGKRKWKASARLARFEKTRNVVVPPWVHCKEIVSLLRLNEKQVLRTLNVKKIKHGQGSRTFTWDDGFGRQFASSSRKELMMRWEAFKPMLEGVGLEVKVVDPSPHWNDNKDFETCSGTPVVVVMGHVDHGKTTLIDAFSGLNHRLTEPGGVTQLLRPVTASFASSVSGNELKRVTFIDTPGQEYFDTMRGRSSSVGDVGLVLVSCEVGGQRQTAEALMHSERFELPVVMGLTKCDLLDGDADDLKAQLKQECKELSVAGLLSRDYGDVIDAAIPVSAASGEGLAALCSCLLSVTHPPEGCEVPRHPVASMCTTGDEGDLTARVKRRVNTLVGYRDKASAVGVVLDVLQSDQRGRVVTVLVRHGAVYLGDWFVVGSSIGRINDMRTAASGFTKTEERAVVGDAVEIGGIHRGGGVDATDTIVFISLERAKRIALYRRRLERLSVLQTTGPPLEMEWSLQGDRRDGDHSFYEAGLRGGKRRSFRCDGRHGEFEDDFEDEDETELERAKQAEPPPRGQPPTNRVMPDHLSFTNTGTNDTNTGINDTNTGTIELWREEEEDEGVEQQRVREYIADVKRENEARKEHFTARSLRGPLRVRLGADGNDEWIGREEEKRELEANETAGDRFDVEAPSEDEMKLLMLYERRAIPKSKKHSKLVLPIILKTPTASTFDVLSDCLFDIEDEFNVRLPIVYGGVGQVTPTDVNHAEVESRYSVCPIYAMQVEIHPNALRKVVKEKVMIRSGGGSCVSRSAGNCPSVSSLTDLIW